MRARTTAKDGDKDMRSERGPRGKKGRCRIVCEGLRAYPIVFRRVEQRKSEGKAKREKEREERRREI